MIDGWNLLATASSDQRKRFGFIVGQWGRSGDVSSIFVRVSGLNAVKNTCLLLSVFLIIDESHLHMCTHATCDALLHHFS